MRRGKNPYDGGKEPPSARSRSRYEMHPVRPTAERNFDWEVWFEGQPIAWFCSTVECSEFIRQHAGLKNNPPTPIDTDRN